MVDKSHRFLINRLPRRYRTTGEGTYPAKSDGNHPTVCIPSACTLQRDTVSRYDQSTVEGYLKEIADLTGIEKNLTFHLARHTFATTVTLSNGVTIETVSKVLRHTKIATTQIYARVVETKISGQVNAESQPGKSENIFRFSRGRKKEKDLLETGMIPGI